MCKKCKDKTALRKTKRGLIFAKRKILPLFLPQKPNPLVFHPSLLTSHLLTFSLFQRFDVRESLWGFAWFTFLYFKFIFGLLILRNNPDGVFQLGLAEYRVSFQLQFLWDLMQDGVLGGFGCLNFLFFVPNLFSGLLLIWAVVWFIVVFGCD